jgi:hypothetical protein
MGDETVNVQRENALPMRPLRSFGGLLVGWACRACGCFNGEAKKRLDACRACGQRIVRPARRTL